MRESPQQEVKGIQNRGFLFDQKIEPTQTRLKKASRF